MILAIQVESVEAVSNIPKLAKPGVSVVTFGPNDLSFSLEDHPEYPLQNVDDCMRNVASQLAGTDIRLAMGTATQPEERAKYLGSSEESVGERAGFLGRILGRLKIA